ncbi:unnamed protein product [Symbiodinium sp. KB8]|nr:unnamed protein product [Symbiodinium sp. KB8]
MPPGIAAQFQDAAENEPQASLLLQQQGVKAASKEEKAQKALAKCQAKAKAAAKAAEKAEAKAQAAKSKNKRKALAAAAAPAEEPEEAEEGGEPGADAPDLEAAPAEENPAKKKKAQDLTIGDAMDRLQPAFLAGLPRPSEKVFTNKGLNISWTKFGMAFGWEIAAICSLQKEIELQMCHYVATMADSGAEGCTRARSRYDIEIEKDAMDITTTPGKPIPKLKNKLCAAQRDQFKDTSIKVVKRAKRTGISPALRSTQEYPPGFAKVVADLQLESLHKEDGDGLCLDMDAVSAAVKQESPGLWIEAELDDVRNFLILEASRGSWTPLKDVPL